MTGLARSPCQPSFWPILCVWLSVVAATFTTSTSHSVAPPSDDQRNYRSLYVRSPKHHLSVMPRQIFRNVTDVSWCAEKCVRSTNFECRSFDVESHERECLLYEFNLDDVGTEQRPDSTTDHYESAYHRLFRRLPDHILTTTRHVQQISGVSVEGCARRCVIETFYRCLGFDYRRQERSCWMTDLQSRSTVVSSRVGWDYYERQLDDFLSEFINYGLGELKPIQNADIYQLTERGGSLQHCAQLCLRTKSFNCVAFDYTFNGKICSLSKYIAAHVSGLNEVIMQKKVHFEKKGKYLQQFYPTPFSVISGSSPRTFTRVTPEKCARLCLEEETFICRSFDYKIEEATCLLSTQTGSDVGGLMVRNNMAIHHFEMKPILDCGMNISSESGSLASPNWPRNYSHHEHCQWNLETSIHKVLVLHFAHLKMAKTENNEPCSEGEDHVSVSELAADGNRITTCVEPNSQQLITKSHRASVLFKSNADHDAPGFRLFFSSQWTCDVHLTSTPGEFASPNWPQDYPASSRCSWRISAPNGYRVKLKVDSLQLELHPLGHCTQANDHLLVLDGSGIGASVIALLCGSRSKPFFVRSSDTNMFVQFASDAVNSKKGFHASFVFESEDGTVYKSLADRQQDSAVNTIMPLDDSLRHGVVLRPEEGAIHGEVQSYRATMWAIIATLIILLIVLIGILILVWRHYQRRIRDESGVAHENLAPEEVPLQESTDGKPNNEADNVAAIANNTSNQFRNILYAEEGDPSKEFSIPNKNINHDSSC